MRIIFIKDYESKEKLKCSMLRKLPCEVCKKTPVVNFGRAGWSFMDFSGMGC
jgi:hypothetical protein